MLPVYGLDSEKHTCPPQQHRSMKSADFQNLKLVFAAASIVEASESTTSSLILLILRGKVTANITK